MDDVPVLSMRANDNGARAGRGGGIIIPRQEYLRPLKFGIDPTCQPVSYLGESQQSMATALVAGSAANCMGICTEMKISIKHTGESKTKI